MTMDLDERFADLRSAIDAGEPRGLDEIEDRGHRYGRRRRVVAGVVAIAVVLAAATGALAFSNRLEDRSDLRTAGLTDQPIPSGAHLTAGYVPAGLAEFQPGAPLGGPLGLLDLGATTVTWSARPLENLVYQDPVHGSDHYLMGGVDREADHPSDYLPSLESSPDVEHVDLDGRHVELRVADGDSVYANSVFAEDGVLVWFISRGVDRTDLLRFLETLRVEVQR